jgi:hypothetical protein
MLTTKRFLIPFVLAAGALNCTAQICNTNTGATVNNLPVAASANFVVGDGFISVSVSNNQADPMGAAQLLNGISFTLSGGQSSGSMGPNSANLRKVQWNKSFVDYGPTATGWGLESAPGGLSLCGLCSLLGFIAPTHLLIGDPAGSGTYASANGSIAGNLLHNPYTSGPATFLITVPGVVPGSTVTSATFFFGTQAGVSAPGYCRPFIVPIF